MIVKRIYTNVYFIRLNKTNLIIRRRLRIVIKYKYAVHPSRRISKINFQQKNCDEARTTSYYKVVFYLIK